MDVDFTALPSPDCYRLMIQAIVPRPVAWVLSDNGDKTMNLAPYSFFTGISSNPPLLMFSAGKKSDGSPKDTLRNAQERTHFVVHIAHKELAAAVTESSRTLPHGESELTALGLGTVPFAEFPLPRLSDCRIAMGCELHQTMQLDGVSQTLVFGRITRMFIDDSIVTGAGTGAAPVLDLSLLDPIGRLGGNDYTTFGQVLNVPRPR